MTVVVSMSATTAAYAAEAVKPSARVRGDGPAEMAIALLSAEQKQASAAGQTAIAALRNPASLSMMLMGSNAGLPQRTRNDAIGRYREFELDEDDPADADEETPNADAASQPAVGHER